MERNLSLFYGKQTQNVADFKSDFQSDGEEESTQQQWASGWWLGERVFHSALCNNRIRLNQKEMYTSRVVSCI